MEPLQLDTWAGRLSFTQPSNEGWWCLALCRCNETWIKIKSFPKKVPLQWYHIKIYWFNLCHSNSSSHLNCRAVTRAHQGWFPRFSIAGLCKPFSFLGLLKHIIELTTLSSERKAIHYSMPQSTDCFYNRITRAEQGIYWRNWGSVSNYFFTFSS